MTLLITCFITNKSGNGGLWDRIGVTQDRGNLRKDNKVDILKYTLSSFSTAYPWKKVIIKTELDDEYESEETKKELELFVREEFKNFDLVYSAKRNNIQQDWIDTYDLIKDDEFVFCYCSHDHVMMDHSPEYLQRVIQSVKETYPNEYVTISLSHWSEFVRNAKYKGPGPSYNTHNNIIPCELNKNYKLEKDFISYDRPAGDSIHIMSTSLYKDIFLTGRWDDYYGFYNKQIFKSGHLELSRIDGVGITDIGIIRNIFMKNPVPTTKWIIPYRELCRHFDGYFYHGITNNQAPSLEIPPGFFNREIKIRYGYDDRKEGWVNINPKSENYYAFDKNGTDYKLSLEELPLFWKNRITEIDINPSIDKEELVQYRLKSILEMIYTSENHNSFIESQLESNILNEYMKLFPEFSIL